MTYWRLWIYNHCIYINISINSERNSLMGLILAYLLEKRQLGGVFAMHLPSEEIAILSRLQPFKIHSGLASKIIRLLDLLFSVQSLRERARLCMEREIFTINVDSPQIPLTAGNPNCLQTFSPLWHVCALECGI